MSFTGVDSLDRSIDKTNVWLADITQRFGTGDRRLVAADLRAGTGRTVPASNDRPISPHNRVLRWTCQFCGRRSSAA